MIFISAPKDIPHAVYGGLMSHRAVVSGALGTVVDGNFRDLDEQMKLKYPVGSLSDTLGKILTDIPGLRTKCFNAVLLRGCAG